jgi:hypothetical protein
MQQIMNYLVDRLVAKRIASTGMCGDTQLPEEVQSFYQFMLAEDNTPSQTTFAPPHGHGNQSHV